MIPTTPFVSLLAAAAIAAPATAAAEIYKWVDERGGITYGNVPPPGAKKLTQVEDGGRVSTVPGLSAEELARQRELELAARVERLERELYEARARAAAAPAAYPYPAYDPWYTGYPTYYPGYSSVYYGAYAPPWFRGYRFAARPIFPTAFPPKVQPFPPRVHPVVGRAAPAPGRGMRR